MPQPKVTMLDLSTESQQDADEPKKRFTVKITSTWTVAGDSDLSALSALEAAIFAMQK